MLHPFVSPREAVIVRVYNHFAKTAPEPHSMFRANEVVIADEAAGYFVPPHCMFYSKMGFEVCLAVPTVCTAVYTVAIPDIVPLTVGVAFMVDPGVVVAEHFSARPADCANIAEL